MEVVRTYKETHVHAVGWIVFISQIIDTTGVTWELMFNWLTFVGFRLEIFSKSLTTIYFLPLILTGSDPGEIRRPSRPEHRRRQRSCQSPIRRQWTWGVHLKGKTLKELLNSLFSSFVFLRLLRSIFMSPFPRLISSPGDSSRFSVSKWTACWGPNIRSEHHRLAPCHTPGSCASPAGQQAGDPYVSTERPFTAWDAGEAVNSDKYTRTNADITWVNAHLTAPDELSVYLRRKLWSRSSPGRSLASVFVEGPRVTQETPLTPQMKASSSLRFLKLPYVLCHTPPFCN